MWQDESDDIRVRIRVFRYSITFFALTNSGPSDPVITTAPSRMICLSFFGDDSCCQHQQRKRAKACRAERCCTTARPIAPVAPTTTIFIRPPLVSQSNGFHEYLGLVESPTSWRMRVGHTRAGSPARDRSLDEGGEEDRPWLYPRGPEMRFITIGYGLGLCRHLFIDAFDRAAIRWLPGGLFIDRIWLVGNALCCLVFPPRMQKRLPAPTSSVKEQ